MSGPTLIDRAKHAVEHVLGIKSDKEVLAEVLREPKVREARRAVKRADRILAELEVMELRKYGRRVGDRTR
jgi:hypothetical protein